MRDKIERLTMKNNSSSSSSSYGAAERSVKSVKSESPKKKTNSKSPSLKKHFSTGECDEKELASVKRKSYRSSSKRALDDDLEDSDSDHQNTHCKMDKDRSLETGSNREMPPSVRTTPKVKRKRTSIEIKIKSISKDTKISEKYSENVDENSKQTTKKSKNSKAEKNKLLQLDDSNDNSSLAEKQESLNALSSPVKLTSSTKTEDDKLILYDASKVFVVDTSTPKSTCKSKNEFFPNVDLSPEKSPVKTPKSLSLSAGFVPQSKQRFNHFFPKSPNQFSGKDSFSTEHLNVDRSNTASPEIDTNNSSSNKNYNSFGNSFSNLTFSYTTPRDQNSSLNSKTLDSLKDSDKQLEKMRLNLSDIGPRRYENLGSQHNVHGSLKTLHSSLLDTPQPSSRTYLFDSHRRAFKPKYSLVEKHSFQHPSSLKESWKTTFMNRCWSLKNKFIDSHCHLDFLFDRLPFNGSYNKYFRKNIDSFPVNFGGCVAVFCEPQSFTSEGLWKSLVNENEVWIAMGCHPKKATAFSEAAEKGLSVCINHSKVVAVGEIGLDYSGRFFESAEIQKRVFICQIKMALAIKKPLVIHCRDAQNDCLEILKKYVPSDYRIHCHCFTKSFTLAKEWLSFFPNLYIGLTPLVTYPSAVEVHDTARNIPLERLLLETDAPYFVPKFVPRGMMKLSHPGLAIAVAFEVAKLKNTNVDLVLKHCFENTKKMYGI